MPEQLLVLNTPPGITRDGTRLDRVTYVDGQWVRFQRGKPRKMGGFQQVAPNYTDPVRAGYTFAKDAVVYVYGFFGRTGWLALTDEVCGQTVGNTVTIDGTNLQDEDLYTYTVDSLYDATGGGGSILLVHPAENLANIASSVNTRIYKTTLGGNPASYTALDDGAGADVTAAGGICVLQPFVFAYGNDGLIKNSNQNRPDDWTIGVGKDANEVNVSGTKVVKGMSMRGSGQAPAGLFWALDSLVRVSYVGGSVGFRYDTLSNQTSILSPHSVIEYDGSYFWIGTDRFLVYSGNVQELPNPTNLNFFFDSINLAARMKVWATKVPKYGEIWWHFPKDGATECNHAIVYNVREKVWYDTPIYRSAGMFSQDVPYPLLYASETAETPSILYGLATAGGASTITLAASSSSTNDEYNSETITLTGGPGSTQVRTITAYNGTTKVATVDTAWGTVPDATTFYAIDRGNSPLYYLYAHEKGVDAVSNGNANAIESYVETADIGLHALMDKPIDSWLNLTRVEPDFVQDGDMVMTVRGEEYARGTTKVSVDYTFDPDTTKIDTREQRRVMRLRFNSNTLGGNFEMGRVVLHVGPGDKRS